MGNKKKMNSYERVMRVFNGEKPDVCPALPWVRDWCSRQVGMEYIDELESVEKHVYAQSFCVSQFGYDAVHDMSGCHSESEAMGATLKIASGYLPYVEKPVVEDYKTDLPKLKLFDPYQNERLSMILEGVRRLKKRFYCEIPVVGYVQAPFRHASMLRGPENIMRDMYKKKENLCELCELALFSLVPYAVAMISAGVDIIIVSDPTSSGDAISKKQWEEWGLLPTTKLISLIKRSGVKTILHVCGDTMDRLDSLAATGADCLSLDEANDFEIVRKTLGPDYCLMGNVSTTTLAFGTSEDVQEATKEIIQKAGKDGHLLMSGGCVLGENCPPENVRAMVNTAKEYRYR